jgi:hypothetical protein
MIMRVSSIIFRISIEIPSLEKRTRQLRGRTGKDMDIGVQSLLLLYKFRTSVFYPSFMKSINKRATAKLVVLSHNLVDSSSLYDKNKIY